MKMPSTLVTVGAIIVILILAGVAVILSTPRQSAPPPVPNTPRASATAIAKPSATPAATSMAQAGGTPVPGGLVRVWNSMCVAGVPYTLLSIPLDARFALVQSASQLPSTSVPVTGITAVPSAVPTFSTPSFVGGTAAPFPTATLTVAEATAIVPLTGPGSSRGTLGIVPSQNSCTTLGQENGLQMVMCTGPQGNLFSVYVREANQGQLYQGYLWDCSVASPTPLATLSKTPFPTISPSPVPPTLPPPTIVPPTIVPPTLPPTVPPATSTP